MGVILKEDADLTEFVPPAVVASGERGTAVRAAVCSAALALASSVAWSLAALLAACAAALRACVIASAFALAFAAGVLFALGMWPPWSRVRSKTGGGAFAFALGGGA